MLTRVSTELFGNRVSRRALLVERMFRFDVIPLSLRRHDLTPSRHLRLRSSTTARDIRKPLEEFLHVNCRSPAVCGCTIFFWISQVQINPSGGAVVTVSASCNAYAIAVQGNGLSQPGTVTYSFTITDGGPPATVSGSVPVAPLDPRPARLFQHLQRGSRLILGFLSWRVVRDDELGRPVVAPAVLQIALQTRNQTCDAITRHDADDSDNSRRFLPFQ
jgi:hypothetical protein